MAVGEENNPPPSIMVGIFNVKVLRSGERELLISFFIISPFAFCKRSGTLPHFSSTTMLTTRLISLYNALSSPVNGFNTSELTVVTTGVTTVVDGGITGGGITGNVAIGAGEAPGVWKLTAGPVGVDVEIGAVATDGTGPPKLLVILVELLAGLSGGALVVVVLTGDTELVDDVLPPPEPTKGADTTGGGETTKGGDAVEDGDGTGLPADELEEGTELGAGALLGRTGTAAVVVVDRAGVGAVEDDEELPVPEVSTGGVAVPLGGAANFVDGAGNGVGDTIFGSGYFNSKSLAIALSETGIVPAVPLKSIVISLTSNSRS